MEMDGGTSISSDSPMKCGGLSRMSYNLKSSSLFKIVAVSDASYMSTA